MGSFEGIQEYLLPAPIFQPNKHQRQSLQKMMREREIKKASQPNKRTNPNE